MASPSGDTFGLHPHLYWTTAPILQISKYRTKYFVDLSLLKRILVEEGASPTFECLPFADVTEA
jgi:hypothetical protein